MKQVTPKHNCLLNMLKAFVSGGFICVIGQMFSDWYGSMGLMKDEVSGYTTLSLILISVILTCLNWVGPITKFAGAGYLVPITGFANSVAACALEFKAEGEDFWCGLQDIYHCRPGDPVRHCHQLGTGSNLLGGADVCLG